MRKRRGNLIYSLAFVALAGASCLVAMPASAELQNVEVGGQITILGEYYQNVTPGAGMRWAPPPLFNVAPAGMRWAPPPLFGRPIGAAGGSSAGTGVFGGFAWDDKGPGLSMVSQWTRLHVSADFTDEVSAFIELDSVDNWGEDFRSAYLTGADMRASHGVNVAPPNGPDGDLEVYQAYIEMNEVLDYPLRVRIGRQEIMLGSEWLVGNNDDGPSPMWGLSFDGVRLTYTRDECSLDAFWTKLAETSPVEEDGDVDFYGLYGSYTGLEYMTIDAYWLYLRDAAMIPQSTAGTLVMEWVERQLGVESYDVTEIHTIGLRAAGEVANFDFEAEIAYQWGDASSLGATYAPVTYGDNDAEYDEFAMNLELGYTFDISWQPRVHLAYAYFGGDDNRDISFWQWVAAGINPFYAPSASVSFNRLFSDWSHSAILDGSEMSNAHILHFGVVAAPTDKIEIGLDVGYYVAVEAFDAPIHVTIGRFRIPVAPGLSFLTSGNDDELGWETDLNVTYAYSEDVSFTVGWDHLFVGDGLGDGSFNNSYGTLFNGGSDDDDADYWYFETGISF